MIDVKNLFEKIKSDVILSDTKSQYDSELKLVRLTSVSHEVCIKYSSVTNAVAAVIIKLIFNDNSLSSFTISINALRVMIETMISTTNAISSISSEGSFFSYDPDSDRKVTIISRRMSGEMGEIYVIDDNSEVDIDNFKISLFDILTSAYIEYLYEVNTTIITPRPEESEPVKIWIRS